MEKDEKIRGFVSAFFLRFRHREGIRIFQANAHGGRCTDSQFGVDGRKAAVDVNSHSR
jgi:hypothetical protein